MKFVITGDWHITDKRPCARLDLDYLETGLSKVRQIVALAVAHGAVLLQPGDLVDTVRTNYRTTSLLMRELFCSVLTVPGQHDLWYHNPDLSNTPMGLMATSGELEVLGAEPVDWLDVYGVDVYGAGWGAEIPKIKNPAAYNVLVTHRMVIPDSDSELYHGQEGHEISHRLLRETGFDLIVTGDNHTPFYTIHKDKDAANRRWLINCGSLLRSTIAQTAHQPRVWIFDTETRMGTEHLLDVSPIDLSEKSVMNMAVVEAEREANARLEVFIAGLREDQNATLDFYANMERALTDSIRPAVRSIIDEIMKERG